jgi:MFS superfamily sulfate permease-like transporter
MGCADPSALALTLVTTAEGLLVARSYGEKRNYPTSPNRDLMAFGVANVASGFTGSFAVGSSTSRTAAMDQAGSRTQLPTIVAAVGTLLPHSLLDRADRAGSQPAHRGAQHGRNRGRHLVPGRS